MATERWPALPLESWQDTYATLHRWTQIVGKVRLAQSPWVNHSWHVPLYVSASGLTTSAIPHGERTFEMAFDFVEHHLTIDTCDGAQRALPLKPMPVATFYREVMKALRDLDLDVRIHGSPNEVEDATPFAEDFHHASYDPDSAHRHWRILLQADRLFRAFRAPFLGKVSPVHFFWGSFDLAVTRFSGREAPPHPGGIPNMPDWIAREAYSHEVASCGFWPGGGPHPFPLFYAYAYPEPDGYRDAPGLPAGAFYSEDLREFVLPYDAVRSAESPDQVLLDFLEATYAAAADLAAWDRHALERSAPPGP